MVSPGNKHSANCIGTLSFAIIALPWSSRRRCTRRSRRRRHALRWRSSTQRPALGRRYGHVPTPGRPGSRGRSGSPAAISHRTRFVSPSPSWFLPRDATLYDNRRVVAALLQIRELSPPSSITAICCGFVVHFVSAVDKILTDIARRVVRLRSRASCWSKRRKTNNVP